MNPLQSFGRALLVTPELIQRAFDDVHDIANLARRFADAEDELVGIVTRVDEELGEVRAAVAPLADQLEALQATLGPISELAAVRAGLDAMKAQLAELQETVAPVDALPAVRDAIAPLDAKVDQLYTAVDGLEPMIERVSGAIREMYPRLDVLHEAVEPLGDLADRIPSFGRRKNGD